MNLSAENWAFIVGVALPDIKDYIEIIDRPNGTKHLMLADNFGDYYTDHKQSFDTYFSWQTQQPEIIRLALSKASYDEATQIMAWILGQKEPE